MDKIEINGEIYYIENGKVYDSHYLEVPFGEKKSIAKKYYEERIGSGISIEDDIRLAKDIKESGNYALAIKACRILIRKIEAGQGNSKNLSCVLSVLSSSYRLNGLPEKSIQLASEYKNKAFLSPMLLTSVAAAYCDLGDYKSAKKCADYAYAMQGGGIGYNNELSLVYNRIKKETE